MNKLKNKKVIIITTLIAIILTLIVLSNVVQAVVKLKNISNTEQLAEFAAKNPQGFVYDATPGQIFTLNAKNNNRGISIKNNNKDVYYKSTICIFHSQATVDNTKVKLTNVVDIEAPGDVVVYRYKSIKSVSSGEVGTITENGSTITEITENSNGKKYKVTYTKTVLNLSNTAKEDFEKIAYLMDKAMSYNIEPKDKIQNSYSEAMIEWYWKNRIKDYIADSGALDPYFDVDTYAKRDQASYIKSQATAATKAAKNINEVSLSKIETEPNVYYGENGKAYIGPLKIEYEGGETSIIVQGESGEITANWATKNEGEETFNEQTGDIESNQTFFAVVDATEIDDIENVTVKVQLSYTKGYKARMALANNKTQGGQNLMFFAGNEDSETGTDEEEWTIGNSRPKYGDLIIHKTGDDNTSLQGVEFTIWKAVSENTGYLRLSQNSQFIEKINEEIDINDYEVEYVGVNDISKSTKFVTNSDGKIIIKNLEYSRGSVDYNYYAREESNDYYGYKGMNITIDDVTIEGGTVEEVESDGDIEFIIGDEDTEILLNVENNPELAPLEIIKVGEDGNTTLPGVKFKIEIGTGTYLQLHNSNGVVKSVTGTTTINKNNVVQDSEYAVNYVTGIENATEFITDKDGKIVINNLEVNASKTEEYTYTAYETYNPNYGYGSGNNTNLTEKITRLQLNETNTITIKNDQALGDLVLEKKYDSANPNIVLPDVGFVIEITTNANENVYLKLKDKNGEKVQSIIGTATINSNNIATDTEYSVEYVSNQNDATEFITDENGKIEVNNLEVYKTGNKYIYKLIETSNGNAGYDIKLDSENISVGGIELTPDEDTIVSLANQQKYINISGYVWVEHQAGKANDYDCIYTDENTDVKLKDLYTTDENGIVTLNSDAKVPVEIKLRNKTTGEIVKEKPDEFDNETGEYTFTDVEVEELKNYEVVFIYDGLYYVTVTENLDKDNGSKANEVSSERTALNSKFATIKEDSEVVALDGTVNKIKYNKDGHTSTIEELYFDTTISATTSEAGYYLYERFNTLKSNEDRTTPIEGLDNINMGIVLRDQPKLTIGSDIYSVTVNVNSSTYDYYYNGRQAHYENVNGDEVGVKFEQENTSNRYTRTVYSSDVEALENGNATMSVFVKYKIQITNQSSTLNNKIHKIANYYDDDYTITSIVVNDTNLDITNNVRNIDNVQVSGYKGAEITLNGTNGLELASSESKTMYITFEISTDAIKALLNRESTYHNATEIMSYSTYYGVLLGRQFVNEKDEYYLSASEQNKAGEIYAGIDKASAPGNIELLLIDHSSGEGTQVLDTTNMEDDETSAPSLILEATEARKVSGTIWEDTATNTADNQKLGDGIYNENEKPIQGVTVELHKVDNEGNIEEAVATYSNGTPASTVTDENGNYTFGYYDEANKKHIGILPGKYVIEYTYNNTSYIVGNKNIDPNEYKSTIIASEVVENAFNGQNERWYLAKEDYRYSDARDNIYLRPEYNSEINENITVTNSTYDILSIDGMDAHTPIMDIGIEFTEKDEANALTLELIKELKDVDFGIVERPDIDITIEKEITGLEIISQTGTSIVPKGDPSDPNASMQYVKTGLDGLVSAEIESKLLQGSTLNLEYTITIVNNSDKDYLETDYYYYGRNGSTEITTTVKLVVDYLDATMTLTEAQNDENWTIRTVDELYDTETKTGLISEEVYNELKTGNYHILTTEAFKEVGTGTEKEVKLYASKVLAVSDSIDEENKVEIIELTGKRRVEESIPGDYTPSETPSEPDEDEVDLVITPPTGTTVNYIVYIIAAMATFTILVLGIVIIKKKIIK